MIVHKSFGRGKVVFAYGKYLKVAFDGIGEKTFANSGAFGGGFIRKGRGILLGTCWSLGFTRIQGTLREKREMVREKFPWKVADNI